MAIDETLRLKVELDQSELGSELASIRTNVASAASVAPASDQIVTSGGHPSQRDSIFWGLGAAVQQMSGDISSAASYASNIAATGLQTGAAVSQAFSGSQTFSPGYISPTGNTPVQMGFGGALSQTVFGGNAAPFLSENQSDALSSQYFSSRFSGMRGDITKAQVGGAFGGAAAFWAGGTAGSAIGGPVGGLIGGIGSMLLSETVFSGGGQRLEDIYTLQKLGMSNAEATDVMGGGYWSGVGKSFSTGFGLWDHSKDHLASVFVEGQEINGQVYKGAALAGIMLDKGLGDMSGNNLQLGQLGLNALITRTGMGMGEAADMMKSISGYSSQGYESTSAMLGLLGTGNEIGMNTRFQNQYMGGMMHAYAQNIRTGGYGAGISAAVNYQAAALSLEGSKSNVSGILSPDERIQGMNQAGANFGATPYGQGVMALGAAYMTVNNLTDVHDSFLGVDLLGLDRGNLMDQLRSGGDQAIYTFMSNQRRMASMDPQERVKMLMSSVLRSPGQTDEEYADQLSYRAKVHPDIARDLVNQQKQQETNLDKALGPSESMVYLDEDNRIRFRDTDGLKGSINARHKTGTTFARDILGKRDTEVWFYDKQFKDIRKKINDYDIEEGASPYDAAKHINTLLTSIQDSIDEDNEQWLLGSGMNAWEKNKVHQAQKTLREKLQAILPELTSEQQKTIGISGLAGANTLKGAMTNLLKATEGVIKNLEDTTYDNRD